MNVPARRPVTAALKALIENATGRPCQVGIAPHDEEGDTESIPYSVLWPTAGGSFLGPPFATPEADAFFRYTVHSIGRRDDQAEFIADAVRDAIVGRNDDGSFTYNLSIEGLRVMNRSIDQSAGPMDRDGSVFTVSESFLIAVTTS